MIHPLIEVSNHTVQPNLPKIVLSMIVGNEEGVVRRCLESALRHVDCVVVSVNGSDRTEAIVREMGAHVVREPWKDFGWNRTRAAQAARRFARGRGFDLANTYLLLLDADMELVVEDHGFREKLTFPHYRLFQRSAGGQRWENSRLLRLDHDWRCVKRTHEYWSGFPDVYPETFEGLWISDRNDGGEHGKKYERDASLLSMELDENPGDARSLFYLAETYFHWAQQAEEAGQKTLAEMRFSYAIDYYARRWDAGDWDEERWFALYKKGLAELALAKLTKRAGRGIETLLEAYEARPGRAEVPAALSRQYRDEGKNALALLFAKAAMVIPPTRDALFVDETAWTTKIDEDIAVSSYYVGDVESGRKACDRLSRARSRGSSFQDFVSTTEGFYVPQAVTASRRGSFEIPPQVLEGGRWAPSTPTVVRVPSLGGFLVGVRLVNYWQERGRCYESRDLDRHIRTETAVLHVSDDLGEQEFLGVQKYVPPPGWRQGWEGGVAIIGLEDQRWCVHRGEIWFTATTFDGDPPRGPRVVLGRLTVDGCSVEYLTDLHYDGATNCEKNWVPRSFDGSLEIIYSYDPFTVLDVDVDTGRCTERAKSVPPMVGTRWRGGAFHGDFGVVHEVVRHENNNVYYHRLVRTRGDEVREASRLFAFDHRGIEYAAGIHVGDAGILVTYSLEDKESRFVVFSDEESRRLFP